MEIIPAINCFDLNCVKERIRIIKENFSKVSFIHFDVSDGTFSETVNWHQPLLIKDDLDEKYDLEVHFMTHHPLKYLKDWQAVGAKRFIFPLEILKGEKALFSEIIERCAEWEVSLVLSLKIETPVERIFDFLDNVFFVHLLSVKPGLSGQSFHEEVLDKVKILKERQPDLLIEVDGGINLENAKSLKESGVDIIVLSSYLFNSKDPKGAYEKILTLANLPD